MLATLNRPPKITSHLKKNPWTSINHCIPALWCFDMESIWGWYYPVATVGRCTVTARNTFGWIKSRGSGWKINRIPLIQWKLSHLGGRCGGVRTNPAQPNAQCAFGWSSAFQTIRRSIWVSNNLRIFNHFEHVDVLVHLTEQCIWCYMLTERSQH